MSSRAVTKGRGPGISPGYFEHDPRYFHSKLEPKELQNNSTLQRKQQYQKGKINTVKYISETCKKHTKANESYIPAGKCKKMLEMAFLGLYIPGCFIVAALLLGTPPPELICPAT